MGHNKGRADTDFCFTTRITRKNLSAKLHVSHLPALTSSRTLKYDNTSIKMFSGK